MRLKPVENSPEPEYPDYTKFHQDRRDFLRRVGTIAGAILAGAGLAGCGKEEPQHLGGVIAPPQPPQPQPPPLEPKPIRPEPPGEQLRGKIAVPKPIAEPPEPQIAGGMRGPCLPEEGVLEEDPELPADPEPPKDSPK
jgi:hypothetical protein